MRQHHRNLHLQIPFSYCSWLKIWFQLGKNSTVTFFLWGKARNSAQLLSAIIQPSEHRQPQLSLVKIQASPRQNALTIDFCTWEFSHFFRSGSLTKIFNGSICFLTSASRCLPWNNPNTLAAGWNLQQDGDIYWKWSSFAFMQCLTGEKIMQDFDQDDVTRNIMVFVWKLCVNAKTVLYDGHEGKTIGEKRKFVALSPIWQNITTLTATSKLRLKFSLQH